MSSLPSQRQPADDWLNSQELADWLKVPKRTVEGWRSRGTGPPACKVGAAVRYLRADVMEWIRSGGSIPESARPVLPPLPKRRR